MQLSERLTKVASMVTAGNCLADVGTDHGYVPIYLYEKKIIPRAIAMDIGKGPLERAKLHIEESGLSEVIETRLSDGLAALKAREVQSIIIAGMGGPLMVRILSACPEVIASVEELILQPQSEVFKVREWLYNADYEITEEHMVFEDGKYYPMFRAVKNPGCRKLGPLEYRFGRLEVLREPEVLENFLKKEIRAKQEILQKLMQMSPKKGQERAEEVQQMLWEYETTLAHITQKENRHEM